MTKYPDTETDLDALHDAIIAAIRAAHPVFATVEAYREDRKDLPVPACLIELADMEPQPGDDPGTEQLCVMARWELFVVMGFREASVKRAVPKLAAAVALTVNRNRWGLKVGAAEVTAIEPDDFRPELDQYEAWRVDWQHLIHIGPSVWRDDGAVPSQVLSNFAPEVGPLFEGNYDPIQTQD